MPDTTNPATTSDLVTNVVNDKAAIAADNATITAANKTAADATSKLSDDTSKLAADNAALASDLTTNGNTYTGPDSAGVVTAIEVDPVSGLPVFKTLRPMTPVATSTPTPTPTAPPTP